MSAVFSISLAATCMSLAAASADLAASSAAFNEGRRNKMAAVKADDSVDSVRPNTIKICSQGKDEGGEGEGGVGGEVLTAMLACCWGAGGGCAL